MITATRLFPRAATDLLYYNVVIISFINLTYYISTTSRNNLIIITIITQYNMYSNSK